MKQQTSRGVTGAHGVGALHEESNFSQISLITRRHRSPVSILNHLRTALQGNSVLPNYLRKSSYSSPSTPINLQINMLRSRSSLL